MTNKRKIHPTISGTTDDILYKIGKKPSKALEEYACFRATNKESLMLEEQMLKQRAQELLQDKQTIEERLEKVQDEIKSIKQLQKDFNPLKSKEFEETVEIVKQMLMATKAQISSGKWNLERTTLEDVGRLCRNRNMPIEAVLDNVPRSLLKYLEEYKFD